MARFPHLKYFVSNVDCEETVSFFGRLKFNALSDRILYAEFYRNPTATMAYPLFCLCRYACGHREEAEEK